MNPPDLRALADLINERLAETAKPESVLMELMGEHGGRQWFADGAYRLRLAGVTTSCTAGLHGLLRNWQAAALRRIEVGGAR